MSTDPDARNDYGPFTPGFISIPYNDLKALEGELVAFEQAQTERDAAQAAQDAADDAAYERAHAGRLFFQLQYDIETACANGFGSRSLNALEQDLAKLERLAEEYPDEIHTYYQKTFGVKRDLNGIIDARRANVARVPNTLQAITRVMADLTSPDITD